MVVEVHRPPTGGQEVSAALRAAALELLGEKGTTFSVREAAARAGVNQGLIYRHFGSKEQLISAATAGLADQLASALAGGRSPVEAMTRQFPDITTILARLVLDGAGDHVEGHPAIEALASIADSATPHSGPSTDSRVAVTAALVLGWVLFREYLHQAHPNPDGSIADTLVDQLADHLLTQAWPTSPAPDSR